jgi:hypothetical protein
MKKKFKENISLYKQTDNFAKRLLLCVFGKFMKISAYRVLNRCGRTWRV